MTACLCPTAALLAPPVRALGDIPWTRAGMGGRIAPQPLLCYPSLHPGPAAPIPSRVPTGRRRTPPVVGLHPRAPLGTRQRLLRPDDEPQWLAPDPRRHGAGRTDAIPARLPRAVSARRPSTL